MPFNFLPIALSFQVCIIINFSEKIELLNKIDKYLRNNEKKIPNIKVGVEKRIIWSDKKNTKTPIAIIYIHGFTASSEEARPLPDLLAKNIKDLNLYDQSHLENDKKIDYIKKNLFKKFLQRKMEKN